MRPRIHETIQSLPVERCLDLLRIRRAHRCDRIRIDQTALQKVRVPVELQLVRGEIIPGKPCHALNILHIPAPLKLQVVNRHHSLDAAEEFIVLKPFLQIHRNQSGLPVVAVNQIRAEIQNRERGEHSLAEIPEPLNLPSGIIRIRAEACEIILIIDEVVGDPVDLSLEQPDILILPVVIHVEVGDVLQLVLHLLLHAGVLWQNDTNIIVFPVDLLRKRTDNVREASCLDERNTLRCCKQYFFHRFFPQNPDPCTRRRSVSV